MSTLAIDRNETMAESSETPSGGAAVAKSTAPWVLRNLDLLILALGIPIVLLTSLPVLGFAVGGAAWLAQRLLFILGARRTRAALLAGDRRAALGYTGFATLGRVWLVTLAVLLVGLLGAREDGLTAAVLAAILVTAFLIGQAVERLFSGPKTVSPSTQDDAR